MSTNNAILEKPRKFKRGKKYPKINPRDFNLKLYYETIRCAAKMTNEEIDGYINEGIDQIENDTYQLDPDKLEILAIFGYLLSRRPSYNR